MRSKENGSAVLSMSIRPLTKVYMSLEEIPCLVIRWLPDTNARQIAITLRLCIAYASNSVMGPVLSANFFVGASTALSIETNRLANGTFLSPSK